MKKKKRHRKAKFRFMRDSNFGTMLDSRINSIQSSLDELNVQLGILKTLSKGMECVDTYTKEILAAKARDNLRIEGLKKLFKLAYGNFRYVSEAEVDENIGDTFASLRRRMAFLKSSIEKILNDESIRVIAPSPNDPVSSAEHCVVKTVPVDNIECQPGHIAECLEIGFAVRGVVTPAEVTVFANAANLGKSQNENNN